MSSKMDGEVQLEDRISQLASSFVDCLVPGSFPIAQARLSSNCEYHYAGKILTGDAIIRAFEESHEKAMDSLDSVHYLKGVISEVVGDTVVIGVSDRLCKHGTEHIYSDRLAITISTAGAEWKVTRIKHMPIEDERRRLREFLEGMQ